MARTLFLLRHAKASQPRPGLDDFDRPLAPRGEEAAPRVGREMKERGWLPDLALVSSARRTVETWKLVAAQFAEEPKVEFTRTIYEAPTERLIAALQAVPETCESLLLIGHSPGVQKLAMMLAGPGSDEDALAAIKEKYPTAGLARFELDGAWAELSTATLTDFLRPRELD